MQLRFALATALAVLTLGSASLATAAEGDLAPLPRASCFKASDSATGVSFETAEGATLVGAVMGSGKEGVVLGHQASADLCQWLFFARTLKSKGYRVLVFDFTTATGSESTLPEGVISSGASEMAAAAAELRELGATKVFLMGGSRGATSAWTCAALTMPKVAGVISLSAPRLFAPDDAVAGARKVTSPALVIAGQFDAASDARAIYKAAKTPKKKKKLMIVFNSYDHGVELLTGTAKKKVSAAILAFLKKY